MSNADRFLIAFNKIERHLRRVTGEAKAAPFYQLVEGASRTDAAVRTYALDLKEYADLRNAIVHERTDFRVIAEPVEAAVTHLERIAPIC